METQIAKNGAVSADFSKKVWILSATKNAPFSQTVRYKILKTINLNTILPKGARESLKI